ncbi:hypothetical protein G7077_11255 [Sphingomonas piscis]|uniref:Uncharacterized protein n=1 Tax=Sphingomonas piscis TaxID=2714943 RepID=A0A6G7YRM7_9SPHN|nr:hypothetical protein [Sphingomonas piscis]QIK79393.1 hypothetical protein G7077_11255 [Sphingomonas piscis]
MNDRLALMIGRAILEYGELDQLIYTYISHFFGALQLRDLRNNPEPGELRDRTPAATYAYRLKQLRKLLVEASNNNTRVLSQFDRILTALKEPVRMRAHLAHAQLSVGFDDDIVRVHDWAEVHKLIEGQRKLLEERADQRRHEELWKRHHMIQYTSEQIAQLQPTLRHLRRELNSLLSDALRAA